MMHEAEDVCNSLEDLNKTLRKLVIVQAYQNTILLSQLSVMAKPTSGSSADNNIAILAQYMVSIIDEMER